MSSGHRMVYLLPHLVEQAASVSPTRAALRFRDTALSYGDLYRRSSQLANSLVDDGMQPGDRVGILHPKGLESAVALYGIMLAGGVYVPLDPFAPAARTEFVMRDCDIRRLVTATRSSPTLHTLAEAGVKVEALFGPDAEDDLPYRSVSWSEVGRYPGEPPTVPTIEQDLCYILYTSGSTGTPKGIMHTHRSALAWADVSAAAYNLGPTDVISNYAPLHFDLSTLDYFGGARAGATTVIIPEEYTRFAASLAGLIEDEQLTVFYTVPLALIQLAQPGILAGRDLHHLRLVLFGGEPIPIKHLRTIMKMIPSAEFVNVYGPTETNGCTHHRVEEIPAEGADALPIGVPYPNVEAIVVDEDAAPLPDGEAGELLIRAPTMMRGYWGRHDLNDRAFFSRSEYGGLPDVFHRTGDLVEVLPGGSLRFHGRKDRRIKARGYRVELDEVEAVLMTHDAVLEASVYAMPDDAGSLEIHAEVILASPGEAAGEELFAHMRAVLPTYAVPVAIGIRDTFPRTSTGKIDRLAMQAEAARAAAGS